MPKVSIIIPVYNAEEYIHKCLNSLINQTLQDIEIIAINDGSSDKSYERLIEYSKKDNRIKVLTQENLKQGTARNKGLDIAQGGYITFVDSDDWVNECYLEALYNSCVKYGTNMALASMTRDKKYKIKNHLKLEKKEVYKGASEIIKAIDNHFETAGKLYKYELIKDLRFQEGVLYEDGGYTIRAIDNCASAVTVPDAVYHYVSNSNSAIKQKLNIKNENDKIETSLDLIDYAKEHGIKIKEWCIYKENHTFWTIKHYIARKDYYLCGIKLFSKSEIFNREKVFLVFNTACFGDVLLCNSLCRNIKKTFPYSKIIFITDKNWEIAAKYQDSVDEVIVYDKKGENKGFLGMLKFVKNFKYKKPFASFITYKNERNYTVSKMLKSRFVVMPNRSDKESYIPYKHANLLKRLTNKKIQKLPVKYNLPESVKNPLEKENYIALCCVTKDASKDVPIKTTLDLINEINSKTNYKAVLTGNGENSLKYAQELEKSGAEFINLVNKTNLLELGAVLKGSVGLITCDTGTMHFGCALNIPVSAVFYKNLYVPVWAPKPELYNSIVIDREQNAENIFNGFMNLINKE